ncbi:MAG: Eco47II family restriction endonuclease [Luteolibacter sp.]
MSHTAFSRRGFFSTSLLGLLGLAPSANGKETISLPVNLSDIPAFMDAKIFEREIEDLLTIAIEAKKKSEEDFGRNIIDPFAAMFQIAGFSMDHKTWKIAEATRQAQKSLQNGIGNFHQNILGSAKGWENLGTGEVVDLRCSSRKIIAEVKNKHSTVSGGKLADVYRSLDNLVSPKASKYKDYTVYFVNIIPREPERSDIEFVPSDKDRGEKSPANPLIRVIDGVSFYDLAFETKGALKALHHAIPKVVARIAKRNDGVAAFSAPDLAQLFSYYDQAFPE